MTRLIGTDLDGTFLRNDKSISAYAEETVRMVRAAGAFFVPVTGRPLDGLPVSLHPLIADGSIQYAITSNGAHIYELHGMDPERMQPRAVCLRRKEMSRACVERVLTACGILRGGAGGPSAIPVKQAPEHTSTEVFTGGHGYHDRSSEAVLMRRFGGTPIEAYLKQSRTIVDDLGIFLAQEERGYENISIVLPSREACDALASHIAALAEVRVIRSFKTDLEIVSEEADKGIAFLWLAQHLGIAAGDTLALGDGDNDRGLLQRAGKAVVMRGSEPSLLALADVVAESNEEDGAAVVIRDHL